MKPSRTGQSRRVNWKSHLSQRLVKETHEKTEQYALLRWKENTMNIESPNFWIAIFIIATIIGIIIKKK